MTPRAADPQPSLEVGPPRKDVSSPLLQPDASPGASQIRRAYGGWVRLDTDNVIRGWVTDRDARDFRASVEILIDDQPVAVVRADRFDPKLLDSGEGDGRYAFSFVAPARFRDGRAHSFAARTGDGLFRLKSKVEAFEIPAEDSEPMIVVRSVGYGVVEGSLRGGQYTRSIPLEFWRDGERIIDGIEVVWTGPLGGMIFTLNVDPELLDKSGLEIAAQGMQEAGLAAPVQPWRPEMTASFADDGLLIEFEGSSAGLRDHTVVARLTSPDPGVLSFAAPMSLDRAPFQLSIPPELVGAPLNLSLEVDGQHVAVLETPVRRRFGRLLANGAFSDWNGTDLADWKVEPGLIFEGGFYSFPSAAQAEGVEGHLAQLKLAMTAGERRLLMSQAIPLVLVAGDHLEALVMARAGTDATVRLRLLDGDEELASVAAPCERPWTWARGFSDVVIPRAVFSPSVEIVIEATQTGPLILDLAAAHLGQVGLQADPIEAAGGMDNAVRNAALQNWPHGIYVKSGKGRREAAEGWFVLNQGVPEPVFAAPLMEPDAIEEAGFLFATAETPNYCRLEIRLEAEQMARLKTGSLSFEAAAHPAARRLLHASVAAIGEFVVIDRVLVVKRSFGADGSVADETVATPGRKLLMTRAFHRFDLAVHLKSNAGSDYGGGVEEYFLVFEFRQPVAMALRRVALTSSTASTALPPPSELLFEDRNFAAQLSSLKLVDAWLSDEAASPVGTSERTVGRRGGSMARWRWSAAAAGSVEVVVCVHDAIEESLACLASLVGSSETPHTVSVVDDASSPACARALEAFVADKPWMRLTRHEKNLGYTAAADEAIRASDADWVVLLNSDAVVTQGWIDGLLEAALSRPGIAFAGPISNAASFQSAPVVMDDKGEFEVNVLPDGVSVDEMAALIAKVSEKAFPQVSLLNGFCTLMRRSVFLDVGGLNRAGFPQGYGEENDLCLRVAKAGWDLVVADHVYVHHAKSASFGRNRRAKLSKAGGRTVQRMHPEVNLDAMAQTLLNVPALVRLRVAVSEALASR